MGLSFKMPRQAKVRRSEEMSPLQARLLGDIERYLNKHKLKTKLAARGGPTQQAMSKWAHGGGPTLKSLESLAKAVESEVLLAIPGVSDPPASIEEYLGGDRMSDHDLELARLIDEMDEGARRELLGYLRGRAAVRPISAGAGLRPDRDRSNASSGQAT